MPWGPEAFERARREDKPIFLSVGYSTCYWCHVMERQCFEVEAIADVMNRACVNIKVDREERPDVDQLYMMAVQLMTRHGGWPMSVWLTHDLKPFYAGTYFPPEDAYGRPGLPSLMEAIADAWRNRRDEVHRSADEAAGLLERVAQESTHDAAQSLSAADIDRLVLRSTADYEPQFGGFGAAPKFPRQTLLSLLLTWLDTPSGGGRSSSDALKGHAPSRVGDAAERVARQLRHTLTAMADGGIRDHLGGGFHRYSTDTQWLVPHFEIMLYDQALLAPVYARAARIFSEPRFATVARGICDFVLREMTHASGTFFTALDAEVDHREGLNYLWTPTQIEAVLGPADAATFNAVYGLDRGPNFSDPHHGDGTPDANILHLPGGSARESDPAIIAMRRRLLDARALRKQPLLDTKVITHWNGLMIAGLAVAGTELDEPLYRDAAVRAADALLAANRHPDGSLARTSRDGVAKHRATLDDYASLAFACTELEHATGDARWRTQADELLTQIDRQFADPGGGYFFTSAEAKDLIVRQSTAGDGPLPSGNAMLALTHIQRGDSATARRIIDAFGRRLDAYSESMSALLEAALLTAKPATATATTASSPSTAYEGLVTLQVSRAGPSEIEVIATVPPAYHLNADRSTRVFVEGGMQDALTETVFPEPERYEPVPGEAIDVYRGDVRILLRFREQLPQRPIEVSLAYQACSGTACLAATVARTQV